jgi:hypothetical protein
MLLSARLVIKLYVTTAALSSCTCTAYTCTAVPRYPAALGTSQTQDTAYSFRALGIRRYSRLMHH